MHSFVAATYLVCDIRCRRLPVSEKTSQTWTSIVLPGKLPGLNRRSHIALRDPMSRLPATQALPSFTSMCQVLLRHPFCHRARLRGQVASRLGLLILKARRVRPRRLDIAVGFALNRCRVCGLRLLYHQASSHRSQPSIPSTARDFLPFPPQNPRRPSSESRPLNIDGRSRVSSLRPPKALHLHLNPDLLEGDWVTVDNHWVACVDVRFFR